jgi:methylated-DNA-[protein]-cysteine S-methyltransferase
MNSSKLELQRRIESFTSGTIFQKLVWNALLDISRGSVITYAELAKRIGKPSAVRAVANAVGANPFAPEVPCHRVIRSDGTLGGYSGIGGVERKKKLLQNEGIDISQIID